MVNVNVGVFNGVSPTQIRVIVDELNTGKSYKFSSPSSFSQNFDLPSGEYMMTVTGMNPKNTGSYTEIDVTGNFAEKPIPNPLSSNVSADLYSEIYYFKI